MLCEGSPLLFYTPWGPVTPMGMYRGARRLTQQCGVGVCDGGQVGRTALRSLAEADLKHSLSILEALSKFRENLAPSWLHVGGSNFCADFPLNF